MSLFYHIGKMKTTIFLLLVLLAEFLVFGMPANGKDWVHGAAVGVVGTCLFCQLAWRHYRGRG